LFDYSGEAVMKKILKLAAGCASLLAFASASQAATQSDTFNVSIALTSYCTVTTAGTPITIDFGTYDAQTGTFDGTPTGNITMDCTRGMTAPTFALDNTDAARASGATGTVGGASATGWGVLNGLNYALSIAGTKTANGTAPTAAAGQTGTPATYTYAITGTMPAGQYGTCATPGGCTADTHVRTLTVTY
jgi:hypothetical protein